jgi:RNA polymerase sigma-70 factor, ECF subfamily
MRLMRLTKKLQSSAHDDASGMRDFAHDDDVPEKDKTRVFLRVFLESQRRLYAYIFTLVPNRTDAEDVLQEVSFVLWEEFDPERPPNDFVAWGCRIAYFKIIDLFRKKRRYGIRLSTALLERLSETLIDQAEVLQLEERRITLSSCVERLSVKDRELLAHRFSQNATTESTAAAVQRSVAAIYQALSRIRHALMECVERTLAHQGYDS